MISVPGIDGTAIDAECYYCHMPSHFSNNLHGVPIDGRRNCGAGNRGSAGRTGIVMCQICVGLAQHDDVIITSTWLWLDTCSTSSVRKKLYMFRNIREFLEEERLTVVTNCGNKAFNEIGEYEIFPIETHFNLNSMAKIIALKDMAAVPGVQITMDRSKERAITVEYQGKIYKVKECQDWLYYGDTAAEKVYIWCNQ